MSIQYDAELLLGSITDQFLEEIKFLGRDPTELIRALESKEKDEGKRLQDLAMLTAIVALRGTKLSKIQTRTDPKGLKVINGLFTKYGVVAHGKDVPMKSPTLPRIASLMPMITYRLRLKHGNLFKEVGNIKIPIQFQFPACGALLDSASMPIWLEWYESFCTVVGIKFIKENAGLGHLYSKVPESERISIEEESTF